MGLSNDLISQFVRSNNDRVKTKKDEVVYGTVTDVESDRPITVQLDGSTEKSTPVLSSVNAKVGDRVIISIKNHTATVTGNLTSPSTTIYYVDGKMVGVDNAINKANEASAKAEEAAKKIANYDTILAEKATITELATERARIDTLSSDNIQVKERVSANEADIFNLEADYATVKEQLDVNSADIETLKTDKLSASDADIKYAKISELEATDLEVENLKSDNAAFKQTTTDKLEAVEGDIEDLQTDRITATQANAKFANIDFSNIGEAAIKKILADTGLIENIVVGDGTITGKLVGVTISGDLLEGNTVKADKLVVKGSDGIYYKLNFEAGTFVEGEAVPTDSLHGSVITAKSITAEKVNVKDLVAFDATIGGFNLTESSIYSGAKASVDSATKGIYLDREGQLAVGDGSNYIKYYKDANGNYKLAIAASNILLASSNKTIETAIDEVKSSVDNIQVGGRNLLMETAPVFENTNYGIHAYIYSDPSQIVPGAEYTLSFDVMLTDSSQTGFYINTWADAVSGITKVAQVDIPSTERDGNYRRYKVTFIMPEWSVYQYINFYSLPLSNGKLCGIKNVKLEKGNVATDWTPSPEDVNKEIANANTNASEAKTIAENFKVGARNLALNTSDAWTDVSVGTWTGNIVHTSNGVTSQQHNYSDYGIEIGDYLTISVDVKAINRPTNLRVDVANSSSTTQVWGKGGNVQPGQTGRRSVTIQVTADRPFIRTYLSGDGTAVTDTAQYKCLKIEKGNMATDWTPAPEDVDKKVSTVQSTANTANSTANSAKSAADDVKNTIDNMQIGGRNLIKNSHEKWENSNYYFNMFTIADPTQIVPGAEYTISFDGMLSDPEAQTGFYINVKADSSYPACTNIHVPVEEIDGAYRRYKATFIMPNGNSHTNIGVYALPTGSYKLGGVKNIKLEKGNMVTDWTPAPEDVDTKVSTAQSTADSAKTTAAAAKSSIDNLQIGGRNLFLDSEKERTSTRLLRIPVYDILAPYLGESVAVSFDIKINEDGVTEGRVIAVYPFQSNGTSVSGNPIITNMTKEYVRFSYIGKVAYLGDVADYSKGEIALYDTTGNNSYTIRRIKIELGNKATDWTPAPEDMATAEEVNTAQATADEANTKAANAETLIAQIAEGIAMLVTDGNGTSLMSQTENGWTFSTAEIQSSINSVSDNLSNLTSDIGDVGHTVDILQQAVNDLGEIAEYVKITTYAGEPCIELGEGDSEFKLRITNTRMIFMEGSNVLAYFNNQSFCSKKIVVEQELQQGDFVWKVRSNGNLGLVWKGVTKQEEPLISLDQSKWVSKTTNFTAGCTWEQALGQAASSNRVALRELVPVEPNTDYILSVESLNGDSYMVEASRFTTEGGYSHGETWISTFPYSFNTGDGIGYIGILVAKVGNAAISTSAVGVDFTIKLKKGGAS